MLAYVGGDTFPLAFRRGWTHGVLALAVLPALLAAALTLISAVARRARKAVLPSAVRPRELLLLSYIAVWTHPVLDTLNVYGVRWLMPFADRWFYGDTLFIVDPWLLLVLGAGVWLSRRRSRARDVYRTGAGTPSRLALAVAAGYIVLMAVSSSVGAGIAQRELAAEMGEEPSRVMVSPQPVTPFAREIVAETRAGYAVGEFSWLRSPHIEPATIRLVPRGDWAAAIVQSAAATDEVRHWRVWARFPAVTVDSSDPAGPLVRFTDVRYAERAFGSVVVPMTPAGTPR